MSKIDLGPEIAKTLREFPDNIQQSSLKSRYKTFSTVETSLSQANLTDPIVKGISKVILLTINRYHDAKSRRRVCEFIRFLMQKCETDGLKFKEIFIGVLRDYCEHLERISVTKSTSKGLIEIFKWLRIIGYKESNLSVIYIELLALVVSLIQTEQLQREVSKKTGLLAESLSENAFKQLLKCLIKSEQGLVAFSYLAREYASKNKLDRIIGTGGEDSISKAEVIESYISLCIMTKKKLSPWLLETVSSGVVKYFVGPEEFEKSLLPSIRKAMLRSPETAIEVVGFTLLSLDLDLSQFSVELCKMFATSLHSQSDATRELAVFASKALAKQTSSDKVMAEVIDWYFAVLHGAEGKLTVASHKINILQAVKQMSITNVPESSAGDLASTVLDKCVKVLDTEGHEGTLLECFDCMMIWAAKLGNSFPQSLLTYIPKGLTNLKGTTRTSLCNLLVIALDDGRIKSVDSVLDPISKALEKNSSQLFQVSTMSDSLGLAVVLLRAIAASKPVTDQTAAMSYSLLSHANEKFLSSCDSSALVHITLLAELILTVNYDVANNSLYDALAATLTSKNYNVQKNSLKVLKNLGAHKSAFKIFEQLIRGIRKAQENGENFVKLTILGGIGEICKNVMTEKQLVSLANDLVWVCHQYEEQNVWVILVSRKMGIDPSRVIFEAWDTYYSSFIDDFVNQPLQKNIVATLIRYCQPGMTSTLAQMIVDKFQRLLEDPAIKNVSRDDYFLYRTAEGQLYDNSCLETGEGDMGRNMKRESKVYSYKDQLEEIQLRKELEEKRKAAGKAVQLTPKQKEAIRVQLEKESAVRAIVREMDVKIQSAIGLLEATLEGNTSAFYSIMKHVLPLLVDIMSSPLAAPSSTSFFLKLGSTVFGDLTLLGLTASQLSLRLIGPKCDLEKGWQDEPLVSALKRVLKQIQELSRETDDITTACLAFCFPMFQRAVHLHCRESDILVSFLESVIAILKKKRQNYDEATDTSILPRNDMTGLLYHIIGTNDGRVQQLGISALLELAKSGKGQGGTDWDAVESLELKKHLDALTSHLRVVRDVGIRCLTIFAPSFHVRPLDTIFRSNIYREQFDPEDELATLSQELWKTLNYASSYDDLHEELLKCVLHPTEEVRISAGAALKELLQSSSQVQIKSVLERLIKSYDECLVMTPPVYDHLGRLLQEGIDKFEGRCGIGMAIDDLASLLSADLAKSTFNWLVKSTLSDRNQAVHNQMLEAAVEIVQAHGKECLNEFVTVIETSLENAGKSGQFDNVRQACVVLMGSLARHIDPQDQRVKSIFQTLIETLATPSEKVQEAVANCLPGLVPAVSSNAAEILDKLVKTLLTAESYGERRGAAYGLAGIIKGLGILSLKQHDVMNVLATSMQDKKNYKHREGALMALELLCEFLGRLFEPYIVHVLPYLLQCLGDSNPYVREATDNTTKVLMSKLSGHGVKLVLPSLLAALNEDSWRTKCGSVDLLGRMAYCAPKQLSGCLPMIVPRLIEVLGDSHVKVQESGAKALGLIGSVIRNPEIQSVVKILLEALQDPGKKTSVCLQALLKTEFVHFVDPPSLALIMPVVQRAFQDRSTENRKMASQIIGNMYSLTDHSDLSPYMDKVMPGLKASLLDPVPEVRAVAAKALGSMSKGMGERCYDELLPWLMKTLISEASSVDRSGGAQGLAEVIGALGEDKLHRFMPEIIRKSDSDDLAPHVRDGYMMMFIYMPSVFEEAFVQYIGQIINPILRALADENEFVRETALRAGQRIVTGFAESAITLLLPELEKGIFDENWRIRFSSVQLLGDLLYKISGVSGKMSTESASDDDNFGTEQSQKVIINALGHERRNRVLAGLYMGRSDPALMVRQAALHVWKVVVANTPKTLREILPTLFSLLLGCLASHSLDKRSVAARTLGDLVRKLGEKILPEIIPILEKGLESQRDDERQGVCIGLSEIMNNTSRDMVMAFVENLVPTLRKALCDPSPEVRSAAAQTFGSLHLQVGNRALDEILPFMMKKLYDPEEGEYALHGLGEVLQVKSKAVLPYLVPQLTAPPPNTKALAILASVAGESLSRHLSKIMPALISVLVQTPEGTPEYISEKEYCEQVVLAVVDKQGTRILVDELLELKKSTDPKSRRAAVILLTSFCINSKTDLEPYISQLLRGVILLLADEDELIIKPASEALTTLVKSISPEDQLSFIPDVRQAIRFAQSEMKGKTSLPGLCLPKGINPLLPIFRESLLNGNADVKEQAAIGMGELIALSSAEALKPSVVHITGPLIRILGDRYGPNVKTAVLDTLTLLLGKIGVHLRAFLPQLQTTFFKAVNDPQRIVRLKAATAMARLIPIHNKPDPLFSELLSTIQHAPETESGSIRDTVLYTLRSVITAGGDKISDQLRKSITTELMELLRSAEDLSRITAASCLGALLKWVPPTEFESIIAEILADDKDWQVRQGKTSALVVALKEAPAVVYSEKRRDKIDKAVIAMLTSDKIPIISNGIRACAHIFIHCVNDSTMQNEISTALAQPFAKTLNNSSNEVKVLLGNACEVIGRRVYPNVPNKDLLKYVLPTLVNGTKEKNSMVRASCESALVYLLHLRHGDSTMNICLAALESGGREALSDVIAKVLRKVANQQVEAKQPEIDDTILT